MPIRVVLADNHALVRQGLKALLEREGFQVAGEASDGQEVVRLVPMDRLMVETDAPYLTPEPYRKQKVNEPAMVVHTAAVVARVRELSDEEIDRLTTENSERFFGWAAG